MSARAVFLDRDGTLIEHHEYLTDAGRLRLLPGAAGALKRLKEGGYLLVLATNQSAVGRGLLSETDLVRIHDRLQDLLRSQGAGLDGVYYCPFHPRAALEEYRRDSVLRKPEPGMLLLAARELGIELGGSWMVGDDPRDVAAGRAAGCRTILLGTGDGDGRSPQRGEVRPDLEAADLAEAADLILRGTRRAGPA